MLVCRHLGAEIGRRTSNGSSVTEYDCRHPAHKSTTLGACITCPHFTLKVTSHKPGEAPHPKGVIQNRHGYDVDLSGLYRGRPAVAVLGGPSLKKLPLERLSERGTLIFSTNNCPAGLPHGIRPHVWCHGDPTHKFHWSLWNDPGILKFSPTTRWNGAEMDELPSARKKNGDIKANGIRIRHPDGSLRFVPGLSARKCPSVFGFARNYKFEPSEWMFQPSLNAGNNKEAAAKNCWPHTINTMFTLLRLAFFLGVGRLYLLGCDFKMTDAAAYSFNQGKHPGGVCSNNRVYATMCAMLDALVPHFKPNGFEVLNCNRESLCWSFPFATFDDALSDMTSGFEQEMNCHGWYDPLAGNAATDRVTDADRAGTCDSEAD